MNTRTASSPRLSSLISGCLLVAALVVAGCSSFTPLPGQTAADLQRAWGAPTSRYTLPDGTLRLEYASGPYGRTTWMADVDAAGRVLTVRQVLNEASFQALWQAPQPLARDELLRTLGRPGERQRLGRVNGEIWSWRYPTNDCLWFQATLDGNGRVLNSGYAPDPACDAGPAHD